MKTLVPDRLTPLSLEDGLHALAAGYDTTMGAPCDSGRTLACLGAQLCLESGNFQKAHCYGWGNRKMPADWDGLYCTFKCDELFDEPTAHRAMLLGPCAVSIWKGGPLRRVVLLPGHPWAMFTAFATAEEGAADYVALLACSDRYRQAWHAAVMGNPAAFSDSLSSARYFTAESETYKRGLVSIFHKILPACEAIVAGKGHGIDDALRELVSAQVYETLHDTKDTEPEMEAVAQTEPIPPPDDVEGHSV